MTNEERLSLESAGKHLTLLKLQRSVRRTVHGLNDSSKFFNPPAKFSINEEGAVVVSFGEEVR